ncbi:MAG: iron-containing alcohol dehydrogenase [Desulfovibrio sp.]
MAGPEPARRIMGGWEGKIDIHKVFVLRPTAPRITCGVGALGGLDDILTDMAAAGRDKVLVVTDATAYSASGAWDTVRPMLERHVAFEHFDGVRLNPTFASCEAAARCGRDMQAKAVLAIGGGSVIDTAKVVAVLLRHPIRGAADFWEKGVPVTAAAPIVAINTAHGGGSECTALAMAPTDGEHRPALRSPLLYPAYAIEDPALTISLPARHTVSSTIDAMTHALEAATAVGASPYSVALAREAIRLIAACLPTAIAQPGNLAARYWLMYASAIAGMGFDGGMPHLPHALEHAMAALCADIPHGEGLGMLLPAVLRVLYPAAPEILADILAPIAPELTGVPGEARVAVDRLKEFFVAVGQATGIGAYFTGADVPALSRLVLKSSLARMLLPYSPVRADADMVSRLFHQALES